MVFLFLLSLLSSFFLLFVGADSIVQSIRSGTVSDPLTWSGPLETKTSRVVVRHKILLDLPLVELPEVKVVAGGLLVFRADRNVSVELRGSLLVEGTVRSRPNPDVVHLIRILGVNEQQMVGDALYPLGRDRGVWVTGIGQLDLRGARKTAWTRAAEGLEPGARSIKLAGAPVGWRVGDLLVVTPTSDPRTGPFLQFDEVRVASVDGSTVWLDQPLEFVHPAVHFHGQRFHAEVLNLERNVRIEGQNATARTHTFIRSVRRQYISYVQLRFFGPRRKIQSNPDPVKVMGRYGLHFHWQRSFANGTQVQGVVARDGGNHAFVAHTSHGIQFTDCIAYKVKEAGFWWDHRSCLGCPPPETHNTVIDRCVVARLIPQTVARAHRMTGFELKEGDDSVLRNSVAVGIRGGIDSSGFSWPEGNFAIWTFSGNVAHNNEGDGIFTWQNTGNRHIISKFIAFHNERTGITHGAYRNSYAYEKLLLYGNKKAPFAFFSSSGQDQRIQHSIMDAGGTFRKALGIDHHSLPALSYTRVIGNVFLNYTVAGVRWDDTLVKFPEKHLFRSNYFGGQPGTLDYEIATPIKLESEILIADDQRYGQCIVLRQINDTSEEGGQMDPSYNGRVYLRTGCDDVAPPLPDEGPFPRCFGAPDCSGHGECLDDVLGRPFAVCQCDAGYTGVDCGQPDHSLPAPLPGDVCSTETCGTAECSFDACGRVCGSEDGLCSNSNVCAHTSGQCRTQPDTALPTDVDAQCVPSCVGPNGLYRLVGWNGCDGQCGPGCPPGFSPVNSRGECRTGYLYDLWVSSEQFLFNSVRLAGQVIPPTVDRFMHVDPAGTIDRASFSLRNESGHVIQTGSSNFQPHELPISAGSLSAGNYNLSVAITLDSRAQKNGHPRLQTIWAPFIVGPTTGFGCGDHRVQEEHGEQCDGGLGCSESCRCLPGFQPFYDPYLGTPWISCIPATLPDWSFSSLTLPLAATSSSDTQSAGTGSEAEADPETVSGAPRQHAGGPDALGNGLDMKVIVIGVSCGVCLILVALGVTLLLRARRSRSTGVSGVELSSTGQRQKSNRGSRHVGQHRSRTGTGSRHRSRASTGSSIPYSSLH